MNGWRQLTRKAARAALGMLLLLWVVHSIFVNEARTLGRQGRLHTPQGEVVVWDTLPRPQQWQYGWKFGPPALWENLRSVQPAPLALSFAIMGVTLFLGVARWRMALAVQGLHLPFARAARISLVAHFFNSFLLGTAGGDVMKAYYAARETHHKKTEAVTTVLVDRVIGLWSMLFFAACMILPNRELLAGPAMRSAALLVLGMLTAGTAFGFLAFRGGMSRAWPGARAWLARLPKGEWLLRSLDSCRSYGRARKFVVGAVLLSMLINVVCVLQFLVLARGLGIVVPPVVLFLVVPTVVCVAALPVSPSGLGVRENLFVLLLATAPLLVPATPALSLSLLAYAGSLFWSLLGGVVYVLRRDREQRQEVQQ